MYKNSSLEMFRNKLKYKCFFDLLLFNTVLLFPAIGRAESVPSGMATAFDLHEVQKNAARFVGGSKRNPDDSR